MLSPTQITRESARAVFQGIAHLATRLRPEASLRPPAERTALDDIAMRRPWNLVAKGARLRARLRRKSLDDGVTVIIVNWNTKEIVADVIRAVQRFSPSDVKILVVDNGSTDGSADMLRSCDGVDTLLLRSNAGHGVALDLAVYATRTSVAVTLDSDAVPLREGWLGPAVEPVRSGRAVLAGHRSSRDFVHPIYAAVDTAAFVSRGLSFQVHRVGADGEPDVWGENAWDTAELMTEQLDAYEVVFVEETPTPEGLPGITTGAVVYHYGGVSRAASGGVAGRAYEEWSDALVTLGLR